MGVKQKKDKQHHVWGDYLEAWTTKHRRIKAPKLWAVRDGNVFSAGIGGVANRRKFYRLQEMTPEGISLVLRLYSLPSPPHLQEQHLKLLAKFTAPFIYRFERHLDGTWTQKEDEKFDVAVNNFEEDAHMRIEHLGAPMMKKLRRMDSSGLQDSNEFHGFTIFLAAQHQRTSVLQRKVLEVFREWEGKAGIHIHPETLMGFKRSVVMTNVSEAFRLRRHQVRLTFLQPVEGAEFITGDQPVFNVLANGETPPEETEFYYPLTPRLAIFIYFDSPHQVVEHRILGQEEVARLNRRMFHESDGVVYASTKDVLEELLATIEEAPTEQ
jgi:hypothetical protein